MNVNDACLIAINQEWKHYERYSALVYPFDNNFVSAAFAAGIPQIFALMFETRVHLGVNLLRHGRSCEIVSQPLYCFSHLLSLFNLAIYFFPPYGKSEKSVKSLSIIGSEIEMFASRPLLAGAITLILTGIFYSISVIQHPVREVRRVQTMLPFLMGCLFISLYGTYLFYATCRLDIRDRVIGELYKHC
ncbi:MAG: hypothetical protein ACK4HV_05005 [Parachlamydiaceae bacterium]